MTTTTPTYQAITDPTIKNWHLGSAERGNKAYCGTVLIWPADTRKVAVKVARDDRHHETSGDLAKVSCGACKRGNEYKYATGAATRPAPASPATPRPRRTRPSADAAAEPTVTTATPQAPTHSPEADRAVDPAEQVDGSAPRARARRKSKADRAAERSEQERARREAAQADATAALDQIDAALAGNSPAAE